jgi:phosphoribosyl-dephospho-CoA transferase
MDHSSQSIALGQIVSHHERHAFQPHYLMAVDPKRLIEAVYKYSSVPEWVEEQVRTTPFVVVRRGRATRHEIPIGVRGKERNQRWAASCHPKLVKSIITPSQLLTRPIPTSRVNARHALRTLDLLKERWMGLDRPWGPGGSVGFELATGRHAVNPESDLDIVLYATKRVTADEAKSLCARAMDLPAVVDIRVETPLFGFSLREFASESPAAILLRAPNELMLGMDPWAMNSRSCIRMMPLVRRSRQM